jgi:ribosomal silencing factor RsfS
MTTTEKLEKIRALVEEYANIDGEHHKQWALCQIGDIVGIDIDIEERGIPD